MNVQNIARAHRDGEGVAAFVRAGIRLAVTTVTCSSLIIAPVQAQMLPEGNRSDPTGSPLDPRNSNRSDSDRDQRQMPVDAGAATPDYRIEPVEVQGSERSTLSGDTQEGEPRLKLPPPPNEFEQFVTAATGKQLKRFGSDLLLPSNRDYAVPATATVPPDYVLNVGDIITIAMTGSIEGSVDKEIDTDGRIFLPRVGSVRLAGVRYGDLKSVISGAIGTQYRGYTVTVGIRQLRGIRVYVTGFANNPGAYSVNSLSTMANAVLAAGGPAAGGSFRSIRLIRNNEVVREFDLYQFVLNGNKADDAILQNEDVLHIAPIGDQIAITGSVNYEAIFEAKPGETFTDLLRYAGGTNSLADRSRVMLYRQSNFDTIGVQEVSRDAAAGMVAEAGDVIQVLSEGTLIRSVSKQSVVVRIEGEVDRPGSYYLPANTRLEEVLAKAGGLTPRAFVFGTRLERVSVRRQQRESFNDAIAQLEISLAAAPLTSNQLGDASERATQVAAANAVLDKMRQTEPDGRVVLDISPAATALPGDFILENNDRIVVPPRPTTVGVFGAVYRPASFAIDMGAPLSVEAYLDRAGGALKSGARNEIFVVRANGEVLSKSNGALKAKVLPGDVIFVPVKTQSSSFWTRLRDISAIIFQLGLGAAAFITVTR
jgi:polysaccharide biosynthesis/export protein